MYRELGIQMSYDPDRRLVIAEADRALAAARPDPKTATDHLLALPVIAETALRTEAEGAPVHFGEAIRRTLHEVMAAWKAIEVPCVVYQVDGVKATLTGAGVTVKSSVCEVAAA